MNVLKFDGVALPTPEKLKYKEADLQWEGYRDEAGLLHKTTVRWGVVSLTPEWERPLSSAELTLIRNAIKGKEYRTLEYYVDDLNIGGTITVYTGDLDYELKKIIDANHAKWAGVTFTIVER